jgi:transcriptional regulator with XRE-family HTH domain
MPTLGFRIRQLRQARKGLTQKEVARIAGLAPTQLSDIENDKSENPRVNEVYKIARHFGVRMETLMGVDWIDEPFENDRGIDPDEAIVRVAHEDDVSSVAKADEELERARRNGPRPSKVATDREVARVHGLRVYMDSVKRARAEEKVAFDQLDRLVKSHEALLREAMERLVDMTSFLVKEDEDANLALAERIESELTDG